MVAQSVKCQQVEKLALASELYQVQGIFGVYIILGGQELLLTLLVLNFRKIGSYENSR